MNIYEFEDYRAYLKAWIATLPKEGRGELRRIALKLNVSTTMISQVISGSKHLSMELASDLADYLALNDLETDYFFLLVEYSRSGSTRLQLKLKRRITARREDAKRLASRLSKDANLSETTKSIFYSSWLYSGVRMLAALPEYDEANAIAARLQVPRNQVQKILEFLIREGLVVQKNNQLALGSRRTYVPSDSPHVAKHHQNWRLQGFQRMPQASSEQLFYTGPMAISKEVAERVREELPAFIEKINKWAVPSESEVARCLNIDWFEF